MLLLLCLFYNINAQLPTGIDGSLLKKHGIIFQTEKKVYQREVYISENKNSVIVSSKKSVNIAVIITNPFKEKQSALVLQHKYKMVAVYENKNFPKQPFKTIVFERTLLSGIQIRPPPLFNTLYEKKISSNISIREGSYYKALFILLK